MHIFIDKLIDILRKQEAMGCMTVSWCESDTDPGLININYPYYIEMREQGDRVRISLFDIRGGGKLARTWIVNSEKMLPEIMKEIIALYKSEWPRMFRKADPYQMSRKHITNRRRADFVRYRLTAALFTLLVAGNFLCGCSINSKSLDQQMWDLEMQRARSGYVPYKSFNWEKEEGTWQRAHYYSPEFLEMKREEAGRQWEAEQRCAEQRKKTQGQPRFKTGSATDPQPCGE